MAVYNPIAAKGWEKLRSGSAEHRRYWIEQRDRCVNGYKPADGVWIPGNYYFYLNFCKIEGGASETGRKGLIYPWYRDVDHEFFDLYNKSKPEFDENGRVKKNGNGIIILKRRRLGFSKWIVSLGVHEQTFFRNNQCGFTAPKDEYLTPIKDAIRLLRSELPPEFRHRLIIDNADLAKSGIKDLKSGEELGYLSSIHFRAMHKPNIWRGMPLSLLCFDEAGEYQNLLRGFLAAEDCFREDTVQFGVPIIGGTSDNMNEGNKDFMEMFMNAGQYNLIPHFIPANKGFIGFFDRKTGKSDVEGATKYIEARTAEYKASGNTERMLHHLQEYPLELSHAFMSSQTTPFDAIKLNDQRAALSTDKALQAMVQEGRLEWNSKGDVDWIPQKGGKIRIVKHPIPNSYGIDVGGVDVYHTAESTTSDSKGCCVIYRRFHGMKEASELPVCIYTDRPATKDEFYDNCLKVATYFNAKLLVEKNDDAFFDFFKKKVAHRFLMYPPPASDAPYSRLKPQYGLNMGPYQKIMLTDRTAEYIKKNVHQVYYPSLIDDWLFFGARNTDEAMAFGIALMAAEGSEPVQQIENRNTRINNIKVTELRRTADGNITVVRTGSPQVLKI